MGHTVLDDRVTLLAKIDETLSYLTQRESCDTGERGVLLVWKDEEPQRLLLEVNLHTLSLSKFHCSAY